MDHRGCEWRLSFLAGEWLEMGSAITEGLLQHVARGPCTLHNRAPTFH